MSETDRPTGWTLWARKLIKLSQRKVKRQTHQHTHTQTPHTLVHFLLSWEQEALARRPQSLTFIALPLPRLLITFSCDAAAIRDKLASL